MLLMPLMNAHSAIWKVETDKLTDGPSEAYKYHPRRQESAKLMNEVIFNGTEGKFLIKEATSTFAEGRFGNKF